MMDIRRPFVALTQVRAIGSKYRTQENWQSARLCQNGVPKPVTHRAAFNQLAHRWRCRGDAAMSITGRCLRRAASVRRPACDRRFGAIAREMIPERVEHAKGEAGPDRRTEIKRHPGDLVLPLGKVVRHDPT